MTLFIPQHRYHTDYGICTLHFLFFAQDYIWALFFLSLFV